MVVNARAPEIATIEAHERKGTGKYWAKWMRLHGRVPGFLFFEKAKRLETHDLSIKDEDLTRLVAKDNYWMHNTVYNLRVSYDDKPAQECLVLPRQVVMHKARRGHVLNINFIKFFPGKRYRVRIPIRFQGLEDCKGIKDGGIFMCGQDSVAFTWTGDHRIPRDIVVDMVNVQKGAVVKLSDLGALPDGLQLDNKDRVAKSNPVICHISPTGGEIPRGIKPWNMTEEENAFKAQKRKEAEEAQAAADAESAKAASDKAAAAEKKEGGKKGAKAGGAKASESKKDEDE